MATESLTDRIQYAWPSEDGKPALVLPPQSSHVESEARTRSPICPTFDLQRVRTATRNPLFDGLD